MRTRSLLVLSSLVLLALIVAACSPIRGTRSSRDDDDDGGGGGGGWDETLPCSDSLVDVWSIYLGYGDSIRARIDTVNDADTFDPALDVYNDDPYWGASLVESADDEFECSYPPPEYRCPEIDTEVEESGVYYGVVKCLGGNSSGVGRYRVQLWVNGSSAMPEIEHDDVNL